MDPDAKTRVTESKPDPLVGTTVDGYRIEEVLGRGGMGTVYRATQLSLGRSVALKVLTDELIEDAQFIERFHREADALSRLSHPNIVTVFERGEVDGRPYIVMEFIDGPSLRQLVREGALPAADALKIVSSVLSALQHAHDKSIVHRDIKPENVLMAKGDVVKVADFGLSRLIDSADLTRLTRTHLVLGTYEYMAPEQREHAKEADQRSDLYATGVVLYEMLTGELPIGRFALPSAARPNECDARIDRIVERSLAKNPDRRYQEAGEMASAVSKVLEHPSAYEAPRTAPETRDRRDSSRIYRPARFEHHVDNLATIDQVLGTVCYVLGFVSLMDFMRLPFGLLGGGVHFLVLFAAGWYLRDTGENLRKYRLTARTSQAVIAILVAFTGILLPLTAYSFWVLFGHRGRTYFEARNRGLSENESVRHTFRVVESSFTPPPPPPPVPVAPSPPRAPRPSQIPVQSIVTSEVAEADPQPNRRLSPWIKAGIVTGCVSVVALVRLAIAEGPIYASTHGGIAALTGVSLVLLAIGLVRAMVVKREYGVMLAIVMLVLFGYAGTAVARYFRTYPQRASLGGYDVYPVATFRDFAARDPGAARLTDQQIEWIQNATGLEGTLPIEVRTSKNKVMTRIRAEFIDAEPEAAARLRWATHAAILRAHPTTLLADTRGEILRSDDQLQRLMFLQASMPWDNERARVWIATFRSPPGSEQAMPKRESLAMTTAQRRWIRSVSNFPHEDEIELEIEMGVITATLPKRLFQQQGNQAWKAILATQELVNLLNPERNPRIHFLDPDEIGLPMPEISELNSRMRKNPLPRPLPVAVANR